MANASSGRRYDLIALRCFGLYVQGDYSQVQIGSTVGLSGGQARQAIWRGWEMVRARCRRRWPEHEWRRIGFTDLKANRPPRIAVAPHEQLCLRLTQLAADARVWGLSVEARALDNMRAAIRYNHANPPPGVKT